MRTGAALEVGVELGAAELVLGGAELVLAAGVVVLASVGVLGGVVGLGEEGDFEVASACPAQQNLGSFPWQKAD